MKKYRAFAGVWITIAVFWTIGAESLYPLLIMGALLALILWAAQASDARQDNLRAELLALAGAKEGDAGAFVHVRGETGIAIGAAGKIALAKKGLSKAYSFGDVREWASSKETAGQAVPVGVGLALGAMAALQSGAAAGAAAARTGFFVTVRDIDNPKWRVEMPAVDEQARWMEILRQSINRD